MFRPDNRSFAIFSRKSIRVFLWLGFALLITRFSFESFSQTPSLPSGKDWGSGYAASRVKSAFSDQTKNLEREECELVLHDLLSHHPHTEVRERFFPLIDTGGISLNFQENVTGTDSLAGIGWAEVDGVDRLVLSINPRLLISDTRSRREKELVLYHEWIHAKQQLEGRFPREPLRFAPQPLTEDDMRTIFPMEVEAYAAECALAMEIDSANLNHVCRAYAAMDHRDFKAHLAKTLAEYEKYSKFSSLLARLAQD